MRIDRCICHKVEFTTMKAWAANHPAASFADVQKEFRCSTGCGLCEPYVRRCLRTGQVVFHQIVTAQDEPREAN